MRKKGRPDHGGNKLLRASWQWLRPQFSLQHNGCNHDLLLSGMTLANYLKVVTDKELSIAIDYILNSSRRQIRQTTQILDLPVTRNPLAPFNFLRTVPNSWLQCTAT